ncbi:MAG: UTP--glucose-1-phosphate uridylyltransferase, partial [Fuerstiella sp.]
TIWQIETAIGAAVSLFENAAAIQVSRDRFRPVKNTSDLLCLRSDCSQDTAGYRVAADSWEKPCLLK